MLKYSYKEQTKEEEKVKMNNSLGQNKRNNVNCFNHNNHSFTNFSRRND